MKVRKIWEIIKEQDLIRLVTKNCLARMSKSRHFLLDLAGKYASHAEHGILYINIKK